MSCKHRRTKGIPVVDECHLQCLDCGMVRGCWVTGPDWHHREPTIALTPADAVVGAIVANDDPVLYSALWPHVRKLIAENPLAIARALGMRVTQ